jgi:hypothetical protein
MGPPVLGIVGLCLISLAPWGSLLAQDRVIPCTQPLPYPPAQGVSSSLPHLGGISPLPGPAYVVLPDGSLCRQLRLAGETKPDFQAAEAKEPEPGKASLLSALVPGGGQWLMGRERWIPFAAVEVWAWSQFLQRRNEGRELQSRYRELAWLVARRVSAGTRTEAGWDYYEALSKFQSSGAYDMDPQSPGIQPETNPETFNGSIWVLARALFLPEGPEAPVDEASESYENAIRYYQSRAYRPDLAWNWGGSQLHRQEYADLIRASDENLRRSTTMIGVILANHLLSAVDALVTGRLGLLGEEQRHVEVLLLPAPFERHQIGIRVTLPARIFHGR